jgi:hypothetical protein
MLHNPQDLLVLKEYRIPLYDILRRRCTHVVGVINIERSHIIPQLCLVHYAAMGPTK